MISETIDWLLLMICFGLTRSMMGSFLLGRFQDLIGMRHSGHGVSPQAI
jgi:hypothetical protein